MTCACELIHLYTVLPPPPPAFNAHIRARNHNANKVIHNNYSNNKDITNTNKHTAQSRDTGMGEGRRGGGTDEVLIVLSQNLSGAEIKDISYIEYK